MSDDGIRYDDIEASDRSGGDAGDEHAPRSLSDGSPFAKYAVVRLKDKGQEDYRLIWLSTSLRNKAGLKGRAGSKLYVVLEVPKLDFMGRLRRRRDGSLICRRKSILTQWELKVGDSNFNAGTVAFNDMIRDSFPAEFNAIEKNREGNHAVVSLMLDTKIKLGDSVWYAIRCQHPDKNVNVAMLFLYLSLIPAAIFFALGMSVEVFHVNDMIRSALGLH